MNLNEYSSATITGTSILQEHVGGIWEFSIGAYSDLEFSGGEVNRFDIGSHARATFSGGQINEFHSRQVGDPHIEFVCLDWDWQPATNILSGTWEDMSTFNIQLFDHSGYDPVIDNIDFTIVPEPATLLLFSFGSLLLRRRRAGTMTANP